MHHLSDVQLALACIEPVEKKCFQMECVLYQLDPSMLKRVDLGSGHVFQPFWPRGVSYTRRKTRPDIPRVHILI